MRAEVLTDGRSGTLTGSEKIMNAMSMAPVLPGERGLRVDARRRRTYVEPKVWDEAGKSKCVFAERGVHVRAAINMDGR